MDEIYIHELRKGMILGDSVYSKESGKLLLIGGTTLSGKMIRLLKQNDIDTVKVVDRYTLFVTPLEIMARELEYSIRSEIEKHAPDKLEANTSDNMVAVSKMAIEVVEDIVKNDEILDFCIEMKILNNKYLFKHSIHTCALALLVSGSMGFERKQVYNVGIAALLHDIGLCEMPFLINISGLDPKQTLLWEQHPAYGYHFANEKNLPMSIITNILYHHERWNGSGFPEKLSNSDIPIGSRIIAVCDEYDRLIVFEKYQPYQAIEYLYGSGGYLFDIDVVNAFTNNLAVYPLGSLVRLTTKEVGVVVNVRKNLGPRPVVRIYFNRVNRPLSEPKDIDLGAENTVFIEEIL